ncbi:poly(A) polymerase Cid13 [Schizosaccharomyces cryophilus OY26]|uniref:polynucleotide adenylyltransferase n=1 Tax=Schizosaccharomyces cryophilus (strain OY26 / ATCC MYA-4695 / CBS 11777 / NBRC 106824 / NRRL Y48691) TaxID=653667 RepID=S9VWZ8_SCHCR|nr:poly(A) polymerase Cid13 [Schizosaccharomyces cryophilus OY26]EPY50769.1 poly(A) polymerase Cid13 [Schizosaccharomyces cryophilus OY26]
MNLSSVSGGCKYETRCIQYRRRIPYSLGTDPLLPLNPLSLQPLSDVDTEHLTSQLNEYFHSIVLDEDGVQKRYQFVRKLEAILQKKWPEKNIKTVLFGSTESLLADKHADIDLCIMTDPSQPAPTTCQISSAFAEIGMEKVVCISTAKVPIVKVWDRELSLSCDCNINKTISTLNTKLMRTYVLSDPRVRPLIVMIKYWAKKRCLNDAAENGTLTSYTISCMVINFLQKRNPPILPSLQMIPHLQTNLTLNEDLDVSFCEYPELISGFGDRNRESLGTLFIEFFRFFGYLFDYDHSVLSVRHGTILSKRAKGWQFQLNNCLCVEEPFRNSRNLANTADDITVKGLQLEFRRAFRYLSQNYNLNDACSQFVFPPLENTLYMESYVHELLAETNSASLGSDASFSNSPPDLSQNNWVYDSLTFMPPPFVTTALPNVDNSALFDKSLPIIPCTFVDPYAYANYMNNSNYLPPSYLDLYGLYGRMGYSNHNRFYENKADWNRRDGKHSNHFRRNARNHKSRKRNQGDSFNSAAEALPLSSKDSDNIPSHTSTTSEVLSPVHLHKQPILQPVPAFKS